MKMLRYFLPSIRSAALQDADADSPQRWENQASPPLGGTEGGAIFRIASHQHLTG